MGVNVTPRVQRRTSAVHAGPLITRKKGGTRDARSRLHFTVRPLVYTGELVPAGAARTKIVCVVSRDTPRERHTSHARSGDRGTGFTPLIGKVGI